MSMSAWGWVSYVGFCSCPKRRRCSNGDIIISSVWWLPLVGCFPFRSAIHRRAKNAWQDVLAIETFDSIYELRWSPNIHTLYIKVKTTKNAIENMSLAWCDGVLALERSQPQSHKLSNAYICLTFYFFFLHIVIQNTTFNNLNKKPHNSILSWNMSLQQILYI